MGRAPCCDKANVKKGPWSPEEDAKLKDYIEKYGTGGNWIALPQKIGLKRCGKSCRLRWLNYLRPNIKHGGFTEEEDTTICSLYISIGSRWSIIAAQLPGRTDNDIKNYWNTRLKKKLLGRRRQSSGSRAVGSSLSGPREATDQEEKARTLQNLSNTAMERLQLHMHLQSLQSPLPLYVESPAQWPKLNPLQQKMIQTLNQNDYYSPLESNLKAHEVDNNNHFNELSSISSEQSAFGNDQVNNVSSGFTQVELDDLLDNGNQVEGNCFKEIDGLIYKDSVGWWSNEFDSSSAPLNVWGSGSSTMIDRDDRISAGELMYERGYNAMEYDSNMQWYVRETKKGKLVMSNDDGS